MAGKVQFIIEGQDRGAAKAFQSVTDEEMKSQKQTERLRQENEKLAAAVTRAGQQMEAAHGRAAQAAARAAVATDRIAAQAEQSAMRRTNLRYQGNLGISQQTRAILREGGSSFYAQQLQQQFAPVQEQRNLVAQQLRTQRAAEFKAAADTKALAASTKMSATVAAAMEDIRSRRSSDIDASVKRDAPGMLGQGAIDFVRGGGRFDGETRFMTKARQKIAKDLQKFPELAGKITEEEFENMSAKLGARMEKSSGRLWQGIGIAGNVISGVGSTALTVATQFANDRQQAQEAASQRISGGRFQTDQLKQLADSQEGYDALKKEMETLRVSSGVDTNAAASMTFLMNSANLQSDDKSVVSRLSRIGVDPNNIVTALQSARTNYGSKLGANAITSEMLAAAGPSMTDLGPLSSSLGIAATSWASIGGSLEDQLALQSVFRNALKSDEAAAQVLQGFATQIRKKKGQIKVDKNEVIPHGMAILDKLDDWAKAGKLTDESGDVVTLDKFLGEENALKMMDLYRTNKADVMKLRKTITRAGKAKAGQSILDKKLSIQDSVLDADFEAKKAQEELELAMEQRTGLYTKILDANRDRRIAKQLKDGNDGIGTSVGNKWESFNRWALGDRTYSEWEMFGGVFNNEDTTMSREQIIAIMKDRFQDLTQDQLKDIKRSSDRGTLDQRALGSGQRLTKNQERLKNEVIEKILKQKGTTVDTAAESRFVRSGAFKVFRDGKDLSGSETSAFGNWYDKMVNEQGYDQLTAGQLRFAMTKNAKSNGQWTSTEEGRKWLYNNGTSFGKSMWGQRDDLVSKLQTSGTLNAQGKAILDAAPGLLSTFVNRSGIRNDPLMGSLIAGGEMLGNTLTPAEAPAPELSSDEIMAQASERFASAADVLAQVADKFNTAVDRIPGAKQADPRPKSGPISQNGGRPS